MTPKEELTLPSGAKPLLKLGAIAGIVYAASRKLPDVPFSQQTAAQRLEAAAIRFSRGYLIGIGLLVVLGVFGFILELLKGGS
jgi:hypothetical protein